MRENNVVTLYENKNQLVNAAIDKIVVEVFNQQISDNAQSILLFGASPLAGTTTTAIDLSIAMAATGRKTLLVDCDVRKTAQYKKLNDQIGSGLADYLVRSDDSKMKTDEIIYKTNVEGLSFIPCGSNSANSTRVMCSTKMQPLMAELDNRFECVIYDLPSISVVPDAQVLFKQVDGIVMVVALGETRKKQIKDAKRKIAPFFDKYYGMIINKIEPSMYKRYVKDYNYYLSNRRGQQNLGGLAKRKKYEKMAEQNRRK